MAELPNRMDWEAALGKDLAKLLRRQMGTLLELLGDPPDLNNVPQSFWQEGGEELRVAVQRHFQAIYLASAEQILSAQPIGVEWGLINQNAVDWARRASFDLISGLTDTTRRTVQQSVGRFFEEQLTIGDLRQMLSQSFGPVRAELIAATETTRAAVEGERAFVRELGVRMRPVHQTSQDERVCPICAPRQGQEIFSENEWPPLHPRCRCWVNHEFVREAVA